ncbi:hypothetical protein KFU94_48575 [Chloroflexi bacterium TSY]|nr:hypothetical protein [Chloroflexi bacterium TSY]
MSDMFHSVDKQIAEIEENLRIIDERKTEYVEVEKIDLQLIKNERQLLDQLEQLRSRRKQLSDNPCPYRGLLHFDTEHHGNFFGRDEMLKRLIEKIGLFDFVAVVGPSGCGKSSLVRAGLINALKNDALPNSQSWHTSIVRLGSDPVFAFISAIIERLEPNLKESQHVKEVRTWADGLKHNKMRIDDILHRLESKISQPIRLLIVLDQFEEVFTLCEDEYTRN